MDFMQRIREAFARFAYGRYGSDQLGRVILYASLLLLFSCFALGSTMCWMQSTGAKPADR